MPIPAATLHGQIIPFPNQICLYMAYFCLAFALIGFALNMLVFLVSRGKAVTPSSLFILSICIADSAVCLIAVSILVGSITYGGFSWGESACYFNSYVYVNCCCISILCIVSIAFERYLSSCRGISVSLKATTAWIIVIWAFVCGTGAILIASKNAGTYIVLEDKSWFCNPDWRLRVSPLYEISLLILVCIICINFTIIFSYFKVYQKVQEAVKLTSREDVDRSRMQRMVFVRCVAVTSIFFIFWSPEFFGIMYEFFTGQSMPFALSLISSMCILLHTILNPILIMSLDNVMKKIIREYAAHHLLGTYLQIRSSSKSTHSSTDQTIFGAKTAIVPRIE